MATYASLKYDFGTQLTGEIPTAAIANDAVTLAKMASGTDGNIITYDASGNPAVVASGTSGQLLKSQGADTVPVFATVAGGKILQAVSVHIDSSVAMTSGTFADITGYSLSITPSASDSKIIVSVFSNMYIADTDVQSGGVMGFFRNIDGGSYTALSTQNSGNSAYLSSVQSGSTNNAALGSFTVLLIDEPATTDVVNYKAQGKVQWGGSATWGYENSSAYMTAMEIGA